VGIPFLAFIFYYELHFVLYCVFRGFGVKILIFRRFHTAKDSVLQLQKVADVADFLWLRTRNFLTVFFHTKQGNRA
jgi:hypothetical protein